MDFTLNEEHRLFQRTAREFAAAEITPFAAEWDRSETMDPAVVGNLGAVGFLGLTLPEEYGGTVCSNIAYCLVVEELGVADSSVRGIVSVNIGLVGKTIATWGAAEQKARFLPGICDGSGLGCFALTEPGSGSDPASLLTSARRDGDFWVLNGSKIFITLGGWASVALVFARSGGNGARGITAFLVPTDTPGFGSTPVKGKLGLRAQDTAEITLVDVRIPDSLRLGDEGQGLAIALEALNRGRMSVAAGCVGIARGSLEAALAYGVDRRQFGRPIAGFQLVQELLADMMVETEAARLLTWRVADMFDRSDQVTVESTVAKYYASEVAVRAANAAIQVHGGYGFVDEFPVGKYLRDARVTTLYEGTSQIQKLIIGRYLTGINAFT